MPPTSPIADVLVVPGLLEGICDRSSRVVEELGRHGRLLEDFRRARAWPSSLESLHAYWLDRMERHEVAVVFVMVWGVYRAVVDLVPPDVPLPPPVDDALLGRSQTTTLSLPTGELVVVDVDRERPPRPLARVPPGTWRLSVEADRDQVSRHEFLERPEDYPSGDGPDWKIRLQRVE